MHHICVHYVQLIMSWVISRASGFSLCLDVNQLRQGHLLLFQLVDNISLNEPLRHESPVHTKRFYSIIHFDMFHSQLFLFPQSCSNSCFLFRTTQTDCVLKTRRTKRSLSDIAEHFNYLADHFKLIRVEHLVIFCWWLITSVSQSPRVQWTNNKDTM